MKELGWIRRDRVKKEREKERERDTERGGDWSKTLPKYDRYKHSKIWYRQKSSTWEGLSFQMYLYLNVPLKFKVWK